MKADDPQYVSILAMNDQGPAPEAAIVRDIIKHGSIVAPILIGLSAVGWGVNGAWSSAYGIALVLGNLQSLHGWCRTPLEFHTPS